MIQNSVFILVTDGFNARLSPWSKNDQTKSEGSQVSAITSSFGLSQLIREPTYILPNSCSSTDLIFIS